MLRRSSGRARGLKRNEFMEKLTIEEIERITDCKVLGNSDSNNCIDNITIDSRKEASPTTLFIPIKGDNFDGRDYIDSFLKTSGGFTLDTNDGRKAIGILARSYRSKFQIPVIAVTGSSGKTSTKEMIGAVCKSHYNTLSTYGNLNNDLGVPLSIFEIDKKTEVAVLELGMSHFGEMSYLSSIVRPTMAVFTNIGTAHIGNLGSREGILKAKMELLDFIQPEGTVIINSDDDMLWKVYGEIPYKVISYGINNSMTSVRANRVVSNDGQIDFEVIIDGNIHSVHLNLSGEHNVYNALAAISVGVCLNVPMKKIINALGNVTNEILGRQKKFQVNGITIIDDCYNANLDSMLSSLDMLKNLQVKGNKYAVLGDMLELGEYSEAHHRKVGETANSIDLKGIYTIGEASNSFINGISNENTEEIFEKLSNILQKGDAVLIKASHGMNLDKLVKEFEEKL